MMMATGIYMKKLHGTLYIYVAPMLVSELLNCIIVIEYITIGKKVKGTQALSILLLDLSVNLQLFQNKQVFFKRS